LAEKATEHRQREQLRDLSETRSATESIRTVCEIGIPHVLKDCGPKRTK
jgi:hypothetical protein